MTAVLGAENPTDSSAPEDPLEQVRRSAAAVGEARDRLHDAVAAAHAAGFSYAAIGATLGVSRQSVWERFAKGRAESTGP